MVGPVLPHHGFYAAGNNFSLHPSEDIASWGYRGEDGATGVFCNYSWLKSGGI